ncbi:MAG TPA: hypothetical protein VJN96_17410 [Vicinamibacterales bacterium]|nr:hypothetical protein [Vicinamibacterales bacterium]
MTRHVVSSSAALAAWLLVTCSVPAAAQTPRPQTSRPPRDHGIELTLGGAWTGGNSFGSSDANLQTPTGSSLMLFNTKSDLGAGGGLEAHLSFRVTKRLAAEFSGTWTHATIHTSLSGDFEGADSLTANVGISRFTLEGSGLWTLNTRGKARWFIRGGFGWMREVDETGVLTEDGTIANIGGGVKYWWRDQARGTFRKLGLRVEGRAAIRSSGISLDQKSTRVAPVLAGGLVIGF